MLIEPNLSLDFDDVLIKPKRSRLNSRQEVMLTRYFQFKNGLSFNGIPIIAANMATVGTEATGLVMARFKMPTCYHKFIDYKSLQATSNYVIPSIGQSLDELRRVPISQFDYICIDVANGYSEEFAKFVNIVRQTIPNKIIIAGNVATPEMTEQLLIAGADIVKVGIGPGTVCTTRLVTGVGVPQLTAIIECADAAHGLGGFIIADGGCRTPGDIVKAFGAGADFVMLGSMLSGHLENSEPDANGMIEHFGMSSETAQQRFGEVRDYRAFEGKTVKIPQKGHLEDTIKEILGGLRSACTYVGAQRLKDLSKCTTFIRRVRG